MRSHGDWRGNRGHATGVPDAYSGERIKAFVVLKPGMEATADEIIALLQREPCKV